MSFKLFGSLSPGHPLPASAPDPSTRRGPFAAASARQRLLVGMLFALFALVAPSEAQSHFRRGDANDDGSVNIGDAVYLLNFLFLNGSPPICFDAGDANDSGAVDIADAVTLLSFQFISGDPPPFPFGTWDADPTPDAIGCKTTFVDHVGSITLSEVWSADVTHRIFGTVTVENGATIVIEAGATILGVAVDTTSSLSFAQGSSLIAIGDPTRPIVFTSDQPIGSRTPGDWGGLGLYGRGSLNLPNGMGVGVFGLNFGGGSNPNDNENSGSLAYVRIEYAGSVFPNPMPGLGLFAIGSGTQLSEVMVRRCTGSGFAFFGGQVDGRRLYSYGNGAEGFQLDFGWRGRGQSWISHTQSGSSGIRSGNGANLGGGPQTQPLISNFTLLGSDVGLRFESGTGGTFLNGLVGETDLGIQLSNASTTASGNLCLNQTSFFATPSICDSTPVGSFSGCDLFGSICGNGAPTENEDLGNLSPILSVSFSDPNYVPNGVAAPGVDISLLDSWFEPAGVRGAISSNSDFTQAIWVSIQD